jgi:hypothetical protein
MHVLAEACAKRYQDISTCCILLQDNKAVNVNDLCFKWENYTAGQVQLYRRRNCSH